MWEEDPTPLLVNPALLPLATLARTNSPQALLAQVATRVDMIEEIGERVIKKRPSSVANHYFSFPLSSVGALPRINGRRPNRVGVGW